MNQPEHGGFHVSSLNLFHSVYGIINLMPKFCINIGIYIWYILYMIIKYDHNQEFILTGNGIMQISPLIEVQKCTLYLQCLSAKLHLAIDDMSCLPKNVILIFVPGWFFVQ